MKSIMRRPSQYLPLGIPKKVSPLGGGAGPKAADSPPVSELESPKLKMAGKSQGEVEVESDGSRKQSAKMREKMGREAISVEGEDERERGIEVLRANGHGWDRMGL